MRGKRPPITVRPQRCRSQIAFARWPGAVGVTGDEQRMTNRRVTTQPRALRAQIANHAAAGRRIQHGHVKQMHPSYRGGGDPRLAGGSTAQFRDITRPAATAGATVDANSGAPRNGAITRRRTGDVCYLPLSFVMSAVDGLFIILSGAVVVSGLLASEEVDGGVDVDDDVVGEVEDDVELLEVDDGGDAGLIVALDDVDVDEVASVLGVVDDDLDGVTTGGVVVDVVVDSR